MGKGVERASVFTNCKNCHATGWHICSWGYPIWVIYCPVISAYRVLRVPICPSSTIYTNSSLKEVAEWLDKYMHKFWAPFSARAAFGYR